MLVIVVGMMPMQLLMMEKQKTLNILWQLNGQYFVAVEIKGN
jgi:hypothetical protein